MSIETIATVALAALIVILIWILRKKMFSSWFPRPNQRLRNRVARIYRRWRAEGYRRRKHDWGTVWFRPDDDPNHNDPNHNGPDNDGPDDRGGV